MMNGTDVRLRKFKEYLATRYLSQATIRAYGKPIKKLLRFMDSHKQTKPDRKIIEAFRFSIQDQAPGTRLLSDSSLRTYCEWLCRTGTILSNPMAGIHSPKLHRLAYKATLTNEEARSLLTVPDVRKPLGLRNRALLEILYSSAIRHQELLSLTAYDIDLEGGFLTVRAGKGGKSRKVPLGKSAVYWTKRYLETGRQRLGSTQSSANLFLSRLGNAIAQREVGRMIHAVAMQAGIAKKVTPHVFRHTVATEMVRNGASLRHVQELLGHSFLATTQVYTRVTNPDLKSMILSHHPSMRFKFTPIRWLQTVCRK